MPGAYPTSVAVLFQPQTTFEMPRGREGVLFKEQG